MNTSFKRPESVLVLVYTLGGDVLLLERRQPAGFWQSVTGSLAWGEDAGSAAVRELGEETGLSAERSLVDCGQINEFPILPAWRHRYAADVSHNREHVFRLPLLERQAVVLHLSEHRQYRWLPRARALALASSRTNRAAIEAFVPFPLADNAG